MEKRKVPAVRFKGFEDDWEQRKVGDFLTESRVRGNTGLDAKKLTVKLWGKGVVEKNDFGGSEHTQYFARRKGQFIYSKLDFLNSAFGVIPEKLDSYESTADLPAFDLDGMNPYFMFFTAIQESFYLKHGSIADGSRKAKRIHADTFLNMPVMVPTIDEQNLIVECLQHFDHLITLHQRKLEKLYTVKKSMLEKMFPKNGSKIPEIRFEGFTDDWEQRKLGDCFTERVESMPGGELISVTINEGIKKFSELGRHDNSNDDKSKYKKVCVGDIAYNSMRMWQGASGYSPYEGIVSPAYTVLSPNSGINSKCLAYQFKLPEMIHIFQINSQGITSDNWNLKYPALSEIEIFVSKDEEEQVKIAGYFTKLDHLITLHQRKSKWIQMFSEIFLGNSVSWVKFIRSVMKKDRMILKYCQFLYIMEFQMENWMPIY